MKVSVDMIGQLHCENKAFINRAQLLHLPVFHQELVQHVTPPKTTPLCTR